MLNFNQDIIITKAIEDGLIIGNHAAIAIENLIDEICMYDAFLSQRFGNDYYYNFSHNELNEILKARKIHYREVQRNAC